MVDGLTVFILLRRSIIDEHVHFMDMSNSSGHGRIMNNGIIVAIKEL
jgi:hypothetical protein